MEKGADSVIKCTKNALGLAILRRCVGTGETKKNPMLKKEVSIFKIVKFSTVITLEKPNW